MANIRLNTNTTMKGDTGMILKIYIKEMLVMETPLVSVSEISLLNEICEFTYAGVVHDIEGLRYGITANGVRCAELFLN